mmetsp:Transcript_3172/g.9720  ORF Transcript_3172/g.9720 Transcript_3172/m.9720 type:complete len:279 (+) Transcript_3172:2-838(+)
MKVAGRRTGLLAVKAGMTASWDINGRRWPITVLHVDGCRVVEVKAPETHGYAALQLGVCPRKAKHVNRSIIGHFARWFPQEAEEEQEALASGITYPYRLLRRLEEFRISPEATLPVGHPLNAAHFAPGQYVDVQGVTRGKGFAGVMKRHGFAGQPASHGNSLSHRVGGSIGVGAATPSRVFKKQKMAGRMGNKRRTQQNLVVHKIDTKRNLILIRGCLPGANGSIVRVTDSIKKRTANTNSFVHDGGTVHFPTMPLHLQLDLPDELTWDDEPQFTLYS